ncbi:hypothetical protein BJY04DRAFT_154368 [Aspergillus karnatakaensis]|uniref:uncharacterized protein n=1 Tax=Aspergillus karnatakaensis TaxID=1810916 RepID=UPI003CCD8281
MAQESTGEPRLPPLPEFLSSWNDSDLGDRSSTRYEQIPLEEQPEQPVGLGITRPSDPPHSRSLSYDTTNSFAPPDRTSTRFESSETRLLDEHNHPVRCPTKKTIVQRRLSWVPVTILVLAFYSTILSGLYLAVACWKPRYGKIIGANGNLAPSTASLLSTLFAKTIELAYVTVCVAFLGQVLTRRAITEGSRGISIADMSMRTWIMQPGSLIVHWESLRYSGWTILGAITLTATLVAMLYTTAAEALITPKLKMGSVHHRVLAGDVYTSFANTRYLTSNCETSISIDADPDYRNTTCLNMKHAGQAFHNYQAFLHEWSLVTDGTRPSSTKPGSRPQPTGSVYDNTTVAGSWIDQADMSVLWQEYGRIVHNVTAAMPHGGIIAAANHPDNDINQPRDQSGEGVYELEASVPSPAVNVLCAGMTKEELAPLVYTKWPNHGEFNPVTWTIDVPEDVPHPDTWANRTVVDDLFGMGPDYPGQVSPIFGTLPKPYNTILNVTVPYSSDAVYLLGASPDEVKPEYFLCSLKAKQSPLCTTRYKVAASGSHIWTVCEENHSLQYNLRNPDALDGVWAKDWKYIASEWGFTLSLNTGISDGSSSNARLLMEFVPTRAPLDAHLPSISEALAVLAGNTLLMSSENAPFVPFFNYTDGVVNGTLAQPAKQVFNATLKSVEYASGGTQNWQGIFYPILIFAFITSALCLAFMILEVRGKQITDFTEPQNLFALAINSPSTSKLQGACGSGPDGKQLGERFYVAMEEEDEHYYIRTKETMKPDVVKVEVNEPGARGDGASPAMKEYRKLATRKSWLSGFY